MSLHTKNKFTPLNHKDDLARNYQSVQSPKHCASPASNNYTSIGSRESPKRSSFSHTETHRFMSTPLINVQGVLSSSGNYKDKRPLEIADILDHDRPRSLNVSTPSAHNVTPKSNYDPHDTSAMRASFLTNKTGSHKSEGKSPVLEIDSNFSSTKVYTTPQKSSNTTYLAEKVYSMKLKGTSPLTSIMPLSKTRSPANFPLSTKNGSAASNSRNELKDNDIPSPTLSPLKSEHGYYPHNERSYTSNMHEELSTPKKTGLSGQKSLGKLLNTAKSPPNSSVKNNESLLLKGNKTPVKRSPIPEKKGFSEKSKQAAVNTANTSRNYRPGSGKKTPVKTRNVEVLQARANRFVEKLSGVFWQINQRNKRVVLVNMLELLHQYQVRVTDYLEHKKLLMKSKYFCMWQEYLLEVNREKQRLIQSTIEDKKMAIAAAFYNSKVLRKVFSKLQIYKLPEFKTQPVPQPQAQFFNKASNKSPNTARHPSVPTIYQAKSTTLNIPSQIKTSRTPQTPQANLNKSKFLTTRDKSPNDSRGIIKPERTTIPKPSTYSPLSNRSQSVGKVLKEMNSTSMIVGGTRTPKTPATPSRGNTPQRQKKPVTGAVTPSKNNQKELNVPRFGKSVSMIQDPMESIDSTKVIQSPAKTPKEKDLDQSFGYKNANNSYEKGGEMFDSILAEILHVPESNNNGAHHEVPSLSPFKQSQQQDNRRPNTSNDAYFNAVEAAKKTTVSSATVKRNNITPKTAVPPKTTRDYTPPKVNKTVSRDPSLTSRTRQEEKKKNEIVKKGITINSTPQKVTRNSGVKSSSQQQQQQKSFMQEDIEDREDEIKMQQAINHRRKTLLQNAFVWLLASYIQSSEDLLEGMTKAQYHYENNLKIKGLSAFLENFVTSFKERQLLETELLSDEMHGGSAPKVESDENIYDIHNDEEEEEEEDDTYDLIISRFRFIVLTEKAMRGFKQLIPKKKKPVPSSYKYKSKGF